MIPETVENARYVQIFIDPPGIEQVVMYVDLDGITVALSPDYQYVSQYGVVNLIPTEEIEYEDIGRFWAIVGVPYGNGQIHLERVDGATADIRVLKLIQRMTQDRINGTIVPGQRVIVE